MVLARYEITKQYLGMFDLSPVFKVFSNLIKIKDTT